MIEYRVRKIERYEVTRYSENGARTAGGCSVVASNLTASEADDIAGAMYERAHSAGMSVKAIYASGQVLGGEREPSVYGGGGDSLADCGASLPEVSNDELKAELARRLNAPADGVIVLYGPDSPCRPSEAPLYGWID